MAFRIKNDEADRLVPQLAALTGESLTEAVVRSPRERLDRRRTTARRARPGTELAKVGVRLRRLPLLDARSAEEILGYDERGLPG